METSTQIKSVTHYQLVGKYVVMRNIHGSEMRFGLVTMHDPRYNLYWARHCDESGTPNAAESYFVFDQNDIDKFHAKVFPTQKAMVMGLAES